MVSTSLSVSLPLVQYQMEMMRSLRHVNIDHLHVGWYQSTYYGSFVSRALLDSQFSYQHAIEESVVLIYGSFSCWDLNRHSYLSLLLSAKQIFFQDCPVFTSIHHFIKSDKWHSP
ncbi:hypothetical protein ILYODFUR_025320 [Ilyodon furcidens]|uniref:JAB1/MPN/MOV34 metalloenzyme domain-containing protein n=1 Tax=Ilyodon furcidens TaxID=33524 RepID=A0ABV0UZ05_9TELE